jgi:hypothetical protein
VKVMDGQPQRRRGPPSNTSIIILLIVITEHSEHIFQSAVSLPVELSLVATLLCFSTHNQSILPTRAPKSTVI